MIKFLISPTVCVKFIRATIRVPSASRICTLVVGFVWSTSNRVVMLCRSAPPEPAPVDDVDEDAASRVPLVGNVPGIAALGGAVEGSPGTGEPRRWPCPEKAL